MKAKIYKQMILIFAIGMIFVLSLFVYEKWFQKESYMLYRDDCEGADRIVTYDIRIDDQVYQKELTLERTIYNSKEFEQKKRQFREELKEIYLGDNSDENHVDQRLNLVKSVKGYPFLIDWNTSRLDVVSHEGEVSYRIGDEGADKDAHMEEHMDEDIDESIPVLLVADITYEDQEWTETYEIMVVPPSEKEMLLADQIEDEIKKMERESREEKEFYLPERMRDAEISLKSNHNDTYVMLILLVILLTSYPYFYQFQKEKQEVKRYRDELEGAYPVIVNQIVLFLGAGMSFRWIIRHLSMTMEGAISREMKRMNYEMENGVPETEVYYEFGRRTGLSVYMKLVSLMVQNLTMGSKGVTRMIEQEEINARQYKRDRMKRAGEEVSTKLLLPMILLMIVVMAIIMIPAIYQFGI